MKALFFLRHSDDIDYITPVIYKWAKSGHACDVVLIGDVRLINDYRIQFLNRISDVRVAHIRDVLPRLEYLQWRMLHLLWVHGIQRIVSGYCAALLQQMTSEEKRMQVWKSIANRLLGRSFPDGTRGVVVFDWFSRSSPISIEWVACIASATRKMGLGAVSLFHGDSSHVNQLTRRQEWKLQPDSVYSLGRIFNQVIVPNELCALRFRPFMHEQSVAVLGSPRLCDEWLEIMQTLLPATSSLGNPSSKLKIAIFLKKDDFAIFWEEVNEVIQMVAAFSGVELIIKPMSHNHRKQNLHRELELWHLSNVYVAEKAIQSTHLVNWADIVIDLATPAAYEAVKMRKPVLAADYLHAGLSTLAEFIPETRLRCRDDVYRCIDKFLSQGFQSFYIRSHWQHFMREVVDGPDTDVLSRYVTLLEMEAQTRQVNVEQADSNTNAVVWDSVDSTHTLVG